MSPALYWWLFLNVMARAWNPPKREHKEEV
jgi:hypothetical protein